MTSSDGAGDSRAEWHELLLRVSGWLADDVVSSAREHLALGREDVVAGLIANATRTGLVPFTAEDGERFRRLLAAHGHDTEPIPYGVRPDPGLPPFGFEPTPPAGIGPNNPDEIDRAAIAAVQEFEAAILWRATRFPPHGLQPPRRLFLLETHQGADPSQVGYQLQQALTRAGETYPLVEAFPEQTDPPAYQQTVRDNAAMLWASGAAAARFGGQIVWYGIPEGGGGRV